MALDVASDKCTRTYLHTKHQGNISNILEENVVQPLLVSTSAIQLSSETVRMMMKIDDIVRPSAAAWARMVDALSTNEWFAWGGCGGTIRLPSCKA